MKLNGTYIHHPACLIECACGQHTRERALKRGTWGAWATCACEDKLCACLKVIDNNFTLLQNLQSYERGVQEDENMKNANTRVARIAT